MKKLLENFGDITTTETDLCVPQTKATHILLPYYSEKEKQSVMRSAIIASNRVVLAGETVVRMKLKSKSDMFDVVSVLKTIQSDCRVALTVQSTKKAVVVTIELFVQASTSLSQNTTTRDALLLECLYDMQCPVEAKLQVMYKKITLHLE